MSDYQCSCPECNTILRIRDRTFVGRQVKCPECGVVLVVKRHDHGQLVVGVPETDALKDLRKPLAIQIRAFFQGDHAASSRQSAIFFQRLVSPMVISWALAAAVVILVVAIVFRPSVRVRSTVPPAISMEPPAASSSVSGENIDLDRVGPRSTQDSPQVIVAPSADGLDVENVVDGLTPANVPEGFEASPHLSPEASNFDEDPSLPLTAEKIIESLPQKTSTIDFVVNLNQPLLSFEQPKPVSRRELIDLLEELLGAPIKYDVDQLGKFNLEKLVTINAMENTTVGSVITAVLHDAGWKFHLQPTHLEIQLHDNK
ncbi:MAG: hypothetical protein NTW75_01105 [Planctomycetales bacterium]|nr:hypothetical protein [Planctomycetales bacterium]